MAPILQNYWNMIDFPATLLASFLLKPIRRNSFRAFFQNVIDSKYRVF